jgi:transketolase N-terminal domain/subunit
MVDILGERSKRLIRSEVDELTLNSGAMGMAAIGVVLWACTMNYSPENPTWFNRDRFILSNGK